MKNKEEKLSLDEVKEKLFADELSNERLSELVDLVAEYCKVSKLGYPVPARKLTASQKVYYIIAARYLGYKLQSRTEEHPTIKRNISFDELNGLTNISENQIHQILDELLDEDFISKKSDKYKINPAKIEDFY